MKKTYNFCAGPAVIDDAVLRKAQEALIDFDGTGISILSISHRDDRFSNIYYQIKEKLKYLLSIPDEHEVLIVPGGASQVFSMIPLNFGLKYKKALYVNSGSWANKAEKEAKKFLTVESVFADDGYYAGKQISVPGFDYIHYTDNETIDGRQFQSEIFSNEALVCCDMSSSFLSKAVDFNKIDVLYAGAQKNIGPAGACLVIGKKELFNGVADQAALMNFASYAKNESRYNTPVTFTWYVMNEVLSWIIDSGGIEVMQQLSEVRSAMLYDCIDSSDFYLNAVEKDYRSKMNVPFSIFKGGLDQKFIDEAEINKLYGLKGHKSVGGFRASLYNALSLEAVESLINFMKNFEIANG